MRAPLHTHLHLPLKLRLGLLLLLLPGWRHYLPPALGVQPMVAKVQSGYQGFMHLEGGGGHPGNRPR